MVLVTNSLFKLQKQMRKIIKPQPFLDTLKLTVIGGHGGNGVPKFGGVGGQGGAIVFKASEDMTLKKIWKQNPNKLIKAGNGEDSTKNRLVGRRGADTILEVPTGITVIDEKENKILGEFNKDEEVVLVASGGGGGCSGNSFIGRKGDDRRIVLDLKLIADVGLVGFPNAGKSTLMKAISNAKPRIAAYPFTTIMPQIGVLDYPDHRQITMADLPGLIEGAHKNVGMGHQFLKHVERTRLLMLIVDINGFQLSLNHIMRSCLENVYALNKELELYDETLLEKPSILLINKMDMDGSIEKFIEHEKFFKDLSLKVDECPDEIRPEKLIKFERIIPISAKHNKEIEKVKEEIRDVIDLVEERNSPEELQKAFRRLKVKLTEHGPKVV